jgi:hypothetical protein
MGIPNRRSTMPDPQTIVLGMVFGRWRSQILYRRVKLGLFDEIAKCR